jgi:hypothetical protein
MRAARRFHDACAASAVTVYPSPYVIERLAHFGADRLIANNPAYDSMCERLDAKLAEVLEGCSDSLHPLPHANPTRRARMPHVMTNN